MSDTPTGPLAFDASLPCDPRFAPLVSTLGVKLAQSLGYPEDQAREIGQAIDDAFAQAAANGSKHGEVFVSVRMHPEGDAIDATVRCAQRTLLELTRQLPR
jgi:hypothetical protein